MVVRRSLCERNARAGGEQSYNRKQTDDYALMRASERGNSSAHVNACEAG